MHKEKEALITETEAAKRLGFKVSTLRSWRLRGGGPEFIRVRNSVRYEQLALDSWIDKHRVKE